MREELERSILSIKSKDRNITSLTAEIKQLEDDVARKAEKLVTTLKRVKELEGDLSTSTSKFTALENRHNEQSRELKTLQDDLSTSTSQLAAAREELKAKTLSIESKNHEIATIAEQLKQSRDEGADQAKQLAIAHEQLQQLQNDISTSTTRLSDLQRSCDEHSRELTDVRGELHKITLSSENKDRTITSLNDELKKWRNAGANQDKQAAVNLKKVEKLEGELSALQSQYEAQSQELHISVSSGETKDRTIASHAADVKRLGNEVTQKAEQLTAALRDVQELQHDKSTSTSELRNLQNQYAARSRELDAIRDRLQIITSSGETKDRTITSLTADVKRLQGEVTQKVEQLEKLQGNISTSTSRLSDLQGRHDKQSHELTTVHSELKTTKLSIESKDHTIDTLTVEVKQWMGQSAEKVKQLGSALEDVKKLQNDVSIFTSQLVDLQSRYDKQSRELAAVQDELKNAVSSIESKDHTITSSAAKIEQLEAEVAQKAEQVSESNQLKYASDRT